jgi:hypothetical protein
MIVSGFLSDNVKITKVQDHTAAGTSAVVSTGLDMTGYDGVLFLTSFGTAAANNTARASVCATVGGTYADLAGTDVPSNASDEDIFLDVVRPPAATPFIILTVARGTSSTLESIWAIQYNARSLPIQNVVTGTITGEQHADKAAGTA